MLPLSLLKAAIGHPMLVELKTGETYNGFLAGCDGWMNLQIKEAICTARDGDRFWRMAEVLVRGNNIKYVRIPDEVILATPDEDPQVLAAQFGGRGGGGGRGARGDGGRGGRGGDGARGRGGGRGRSGDGARGRGAGRGRGEGRGDARGGRGGRGGRGV
ncbi:hypothetical protein KFE25_006569 [Diacronema lutheri]|uniref:U6 snRNA-associated Sm-like protein LSm4 n=1 Tax=Diacronema lutheri TaxID=2081491 RepID=A0A8J6C353_DIALT|nr:hypothetical protein KFE25_006569 [Diacronema lutheri]